MPGTAQAPPRTQNLEQLRGEHDVAVLLPFPLLDAQHHALTVDGREREVDRLRDAEPGGVARRQDRAMMGGGHMLEELDDFGGTQHDRDALRLPRGRNDRLDRPAFVERDGVEEPKGGDGDGDAARGQVPLVGQVHEVGANLLGPQLIGRAVEVPGEAGHLLGVGPLGQRRQIAKLHVLEHALAKRRHGLTPRLTAG